MCVATLGINESLPRGTVRQFFVSAFFWVVGVRLCRCAFSFRSVGGFSLCCQAV
ncbi:hypothetical protein AKJ16_DCAP18174, partial [Drosera capensis]